MRRPRRDSYERGTVCFRRGLYQEWAEGLRIAAASFHFGWRSGCITQTGGIYRLHSTETVKERLIVGEWMDVGGLLDWV